MLYVFEDNEALTEDDNQRQESHNETCVKNPQSCFGLVVWQNYNLGSKLQIRYIDTKHQFADIFTKGNSTRDEWTSLLHLFSISHFSSICCTKLFSLISCITMAKRIQEQTEEERVVSKSRPAWMNMSSNLIATSSSAASSPIASKSLVMSGASGRTGSRMNLAASSFDAASASQVRLEDLYLGGLKEEQQGNLTHEKNKLQKKLMILNLSLGITSLLLKLTKLVANHLQEKQQNPSLQRLRKVIKIRKRHGRAVFNYRYSQLNLQIDVFFMVWEIHGNFHDESMGGLNAHLSIWRMFLHTALQALISIGKEFDETSFESKKKFITSQTID